RLTGDQTNTAMAATHVATLAALPTEVVQATALFADGDIKPAEEMIRAFLLREGDHPEAMRLLAKIALHYDVLDDAEALLGGVLALVPDHHAARFDYATVLVKRQKYGAAQAEVARLQAHDTGNLDYQALAATIAGGSGRHDAAIALYQAMIAQQPDDADIYLWLGHALKTVGRLDEAIVTYRGAIARRADFGDAWWSLANLKTYRFSADDIAAMRAQEARTDVAEIDRVHLAFALGKALEDARDYEQSWHYYAQGNALQRQNSKYRPEIMETNTRLQRQVCTPAFFAARHGWGDPAPDPIFIVGLPRAGSTLIEQILASHSAVEGTQELIDIQRMVIALNGRDPDLDNPRYPGALADLSADDARALGTRYLADTQVYRTGTPRFIDKMPNNFRHIGFIHLILPNAKIIDARRAPMACCFSNLKQLFAQGQEFTYSIEDIARYYRTYVELMAHWDAVLPGRVLRVQHEDVIDNLEREVRRILDYCGLPF
ncbi:MAG: sulfotransferase, partial [Alphaproteobacteria bacterium]|nr:sulfotransferase [Alphaproteobacteria bacterium]